MKLWKQSTDTSFCFPPRRRRSGFQYSVTLCQRTATGESGLDTKLFEQSVHATGVSDFYVSSSVEDSDIRRLLRDNYILWPLSSILFKRSFSAMLKQFYCLESPPTPIHTRVPSVMEHHHSPSQVSCHNACMYRKRREEEERKKKKRCAALQKGSKRRICSLSPDLDIYFSPLRARPLQPPYP